MKHRQWNWKYCNGFLLEIGMGFWHWKMETLDNNINNGIGKQKLETMAMQILDDFFLIDIGKWFLISILDPTTTFVSLNLF